MRNKLINKLSYTLCLAMMFFASCSEDDVASQYLYEFPTATIATMEIGDKGSFSFESAGSWNLLTESSWIKFIEGDDKVSSMTGNEGKYTVDYIITSANWGFNETEATIKLFMNSQSAIVATITRTANTPSFKVIQSDPETGTEEVVNNVSLNWSDNSSMHTARIKFSSNFDWEIQGMPEWIANNNSLNYPTKGDAGETQYFFFSANYDAYELKEMNATITIVNQHDPTVTQTFTISADGAEKLLVLPSHIKYNGLTFDANGKTTTTNGDLIDSYDFSVLTQSGGYFLRAVNHEVGQDGKKYYGVDYGTGNFEFDSEWVYADPLDQEEHGEFVTNYNFSIAVQTNKDAERTSTVFGLPRAIIAEINFDVEKMFESDGSILPEFEQYIIGEITQKGMEDANAGDLKFSYPELAEMYGATFFQSTNQDLIDSYVSDFGIEPNNVFELTYERSSSSRGASINWTLDDEPFFEIDEDCKSWLSAEPGDGKFSVQMNPETPGEFYGSVIIMVNERPKYAIYCTLLDGSVEE